MNSCLTLKSKRIIFLLTLLIVTSLLTALCVQSAYADGEKLTDSLEDVLSSSSGQDIVEKVDEGGFKAVTTLRSIAIVAAVLFLVWAGVIFWGAGGNPGKISEAKSKLIWFFVALIFIFMAENIFATLAEFFGIELK